MIIQKNNDYYNKEFVNNIEEYQFESTIIDKDIIEIDGLKLQSELDIQSSIDLLGKTRLQLKIPLDI